MLYLYCICTEQLRNKDNNRKKKKESENTSSVIKDNMFCAEMFGVDNGTFVGIFDLDTASHHRR